jgi:hypothetical protein
MSNVELLKWLGEQVDSGVQNDDLLSGFPLLQVYFFNRVTIANRAFQCGFNVVYNTGSLGMSKYFIKKLCSIIQRHQESF